MPGCLSCPAHQIWDTFEIFPNFTRQNQIKRQGWDKHYQNREGTKMGEKECKSLELEVELVNTGSDFTGFSKLNWLFEGCVILRLANRSHQQRVRQQHQKEIKYWGREKCICHMLCNKIWSKHKVGHHGFTTCVKALLLTLNLVMMLSMNV